MFCKKSHNTINIISGISVCGVMLATFAMICALSVFNGFKDTIATLFTAFDAPLKVIPLEGKVFDCTIQAVDEITKLPFVSATAQVIEESALAQYRERQTMVVIKGISDNFEQITPFDSILYGRGELILKDEVANYGIPGIGLVSSLGTGIRFVDPIEIYAPKRGAQINLANPANSLTCLNLFSNGLVFAVNQEKYDSNYIVTSLDFAQELFNYTNEISYLEIKLMEGANINQAKREIQKILGDGFVVQDQYEQQADTYRIMEIEKFVSYLFLSFILLIACFNVIGSLSMLIIDKKSDIITLRNLGANPSTISSIFIFEGNLITFLGAISGLVLGVFLCYIQQEFGIITLGNEDSMNSFVINAYPVSVQITDIMQVLITVIVIGLIAVYFPVRKICQRISNNL